MANETDGASNHERLLAAARSDDVDMLLEVFETKDLDINYQDGLGNTGISSTSLGVSSVIPSTIALHGFDVHDHTSASSGSIEVLDHILSHENCDVDPVNYIERATPLHLAVKLSDPESRPDVVQTLLEAGANTSIKNKFGETALDLVHGDDVKLRTLFRKATASQMVSRHDLADDSDDDDVSGSEE